ncbi:MAG TPA: M28 family peptidase [Flavisolibacter sp.]|jgi:Iap family predicted aminopeptidase|nr:M28 family peptidase [Flavisolibacter sp.]
MIRLVIAISLLCTGVLAKAQYTVDSIKSSDAELILQFLAGDSLKGRGNGTKELSIAADFIVSRFRQAGLQPLPETGSFLLPFAVNRNKHKSRQDSLYNVVGVLPGKSRAGEIVIFSAHYDHIGEEDGVIYNGANDNASGTTAVLLLADYFARKGDNERTILFCAFAGEELGLLGSDAFAEVLKPEAVVAVINIEMIGIPSVGKNAFFLTGANYSNLQSILRKNLDKVYKIRREPSYEKQLFSRSDNYPFARKGIPAHTIMASDDEDTCYHQTCDDVRRVSIGNMTNLIRAIALGSATLINGIDTPTRINPERIR